MSSPIFGPWILVRIRLQLEPRKFAEGLIQRLWLASIALAMFLVALVVHEHLKSVLAGWTWLIPSSRESVHTYNSALPWLTLIRSGVFIDNSWGEPSSKPWSAVRFALSWWWMPCCQSRIGHLQASNPGSTIIPLQAFLILGVEAWLKTLLPCLCTGFCQYG